MRTPLKVHSPGPAWSERPLCGAYTVAPAPTSRRSSFVSCGFCRRLLRILRGKRE